MANVLTKMISGISKSDAVRIMPLGDIHIGAKACDEKLFRQSVKYIKDNNLYWIGMGDYCDFINKKDPRFDLASLADWIQRPELADLAKAQRNRFLDIVRPIASRCLGLIAGNHEGTIYKHYERDIYSDIVTGVKEAGGFKDDDRLALGYSGWIRLQFGRKGSKQDRRTIMVNLHHGFVGGKLAGAKALNMQRWLWSHEADIVIFGHSHNTGTQREAVERVNKVNEIVTVDRVGCYAGTYLRTTVEGATTYSEIKGYFPLPMGGVEIYLYPYAEKIRVMT